MPQGKKPIVLLIEADASLRRLIALGLQHRNMHVVEASSLAHATLTETPDLLIVDVDTGVHRDVSLLATAQTTLASVPTIVLAWERFPIISNTLVTPAQTQLSCLTKPFDARIMHESIDRLLAVREARDAQLLAQAEEVLLATYKAQTPPSICPMITAIGLFIAFIGMLFHIAIIVLGLVIALVAFLWWTLGTKTTQKKVALG